MGNGCPGTAIGNRHERDNRDQPGLAWRGARSGPNDDPNNSYCLIFDCFHYMIQSMAKKRVLAPPRHGRDRPLAKSGGILLQIIFVDSIFETEF